MNPLYSGSRANVNAWGVNLSWQQNLQQFAFIHGCDPL
jgi:hypothetical protein